MCSFTSLLSRKLKVPTPDGFIVAADRFTMHPPPARYLSSSLFLDSDSLFCNAMIEGTQTNSVLREGWGRQEKKREKEYQSFSSSACFWQVIDLCVLVCTVSLSCLLLSFSAHKNTVNPSALIHIQSVSAVLKYAHSLTCPSHFYEPFLSVRIHVCVVHPEWLLYKKKSSRCWLLAILILHVQYCNTFF